MLRSSHQPSSVVGRGVSRFTIHVSELIAATDRGMGPGNPDGMKIDAAGTIFMTGPGGVWVFAPDGARLGLLRFPERTSNLAWGAAPGELYVTATTSVYRLAVGPGA